MRGLVDVSAVSLFLQYESDDFIGKTHQLGAFSLSKRFSIGHLDSVPIGSFTIPRY